MLLCYRRFYDAVDASAKVPPKQEASKSTIEAFVISDSNDSYHSADEIVPRGKPSSPKTPKVPGTPTTPKTRKTPSGLKYNFINKQETGGTILAVYYALEVKKKFGT